MSCQRTITHQYSVALVGCQSTIYEVDDTIEPPCDVGVETVSDGYMHEHDAGVERSAHVCFEGRYDVGDTKIPKGARCLDGGKIREIKTSGDQRRSVAISLCFTPWSSISDRPYEGRLPGCRRERWRH